MPYLTVTIGELFKIIAIIGAKLFLKFLILASSLHRVGSNTAWVQVLPLSRISWVTASLIGHMSTMLVLALRVVIRIKCVNKGKCLEQEQCLVHKKAQSKISCC